jgi:hypothetical protein
MAPMSDLKRESHWLPYGFALFFFIGFVKAAAALGDMQIGQGDFHLQGQARLIKEIHVYKEQGLYTFVWVTPPQFANKEFQTSGDNCRISESVLNWFYLWPKLSEPVDVYRTDKDQSVVGPCYDFSLWTLIVNSVAVVGFIIFGRKLVASLSPEELARAKEYRKWGS